MPKGNAGVARKTLREKLLSNFEMIPFAGCWIWMGKIQARVDGSEGYGIVAEPLTQRELYVHRAMYETFVGPVPDGLDVCHRCDVRSCGNPDHLFPGTRKVNILDACQKGRMSKKLTWDDVRAIRARRGTGEVLGRIALDYGVTSVLVSLIARNKIWREAA